jgi:hypothetical protein
VIQQRGQGTDAAPHQFGHVRGIDRNRVFVGPDVHRRAERQQARRLSGILSLPPNGQLGGLQPADEFFVA